MTECEPTSRPVLLFCLLALGYAVYLALGAAVFSALELPYEALLRQELRAIKLRFLRDNDCVADDRLDALLSKVMEAGNYGVSALKNASAGWNWDVASALFFASTVLSTTGYGHTVPLSDGGKAFCILYSVIGIPFTLLFLTAVVQRIMVFTTRRPVEYAQQHWALTHSRVASAHAVALAVLSLTLFFIAPAIIFSVLEEEWNFLESFYFCFISLSTIGLGDYVPGEGHNQRYRQLYKVAITVYLLLGLIAMLVVLETFCELQQLKQLRRLFYLRKEKLEEQLAILDQDQLSICSGSDHAASFRQGRAESFADTTSPVGEQPLTP
ncbi:potassium channel subfamily K member 1a [Brienomyrus brachyistius]|uniref:potassium channel subfamily K member 1a n=1 Tax=Brienomyrus brachyistius TaxID=42636 RepID=UPI0020B18259|nr:potassium channel subfamily K member 1a [Brienomyrus brachyistius]XP_048843128.1 potassium channel subfamily K member 1a [Brienomyrus brachyistius]